MATHTTFMVTEMLCSLVANGWVLAFVADAQLTTNDY